MMNVTPFLLIFFLLFSLSSSSSSNPEFKALQSFKLSSDNTNTLSSWSSSTHPCSWLGVTCNTQLTQVTRLVLQNLNLTGSIQPLTQLTHLRILSLKYNNLSSHSTLNLTSFKNLKLLYLSHNKFSGEFPSGITSLRRLRRVDLSYNRFSGEIPLPPLSELPHLITLRLESNSFNGLLQSSNSFKALLELNVSVNNLSGEIPKPLSVFQSSSFIGNRNLCGKPLLNQCLKPLPAGILDHHGKKKFSVKSILMIILIDLSIVALIGFLIFCCCRTIRSRKSSGIKKKDVELKSRKCRKNENGEMVFFEGCRDFKVDQLLKGSAEMLGNGTVGTTYKVVMDDGNVVVVKRAKWRRKKKEIEGLLNAIGGLRHCNVVSLRACYCSRDELLLVYDFLSNGSLHSLLHGNRGPGRTPLDWATRLKLALGIAEGLLFLHDTSKSKLSHCHLTSRNVVIDKHGNACISDVALHQLFLIATPTNTAYTAPELLLSTRKPSKFYQGGDVYSFGVILLEILTGKIADGAEETNLVKWVQAMVRDGVTSEIFDFELLRYKKMEEEMLALLHVALLCLFPVPDDRPKINAVHKMIKDIKARKIGRVVSSSTSTDLPSESDASSSP